MPFCDFCMPNRRRTATVGFRYPERALWWFSCDDHEYRANAYAASVDGSAESQQRWTIAGTTVRDAALLDRMGDWSEIPPDTFGVPIVHEESVFTEDESLSDKSLERRI